MLTIKNKKGVHNRPAYGPWYERYNKDERKVRRKLIKAIRHKLLFHIELTNDESEYQKRYHIDIDTKMDYQGNVKHSSKTDKWVSDGEDIYRHHDIKRKNIK